MTRGLRCGLLHPHIFITTGAATGESKCAGSMLIDGPDVLHGDERPCPRAALLAAVAQF